VVIKPKLALAIIFTVYFFCQKRLMQEINTRASSDFSNAFLWSLLIVQAAFSASEI